MNVKRLRRAALVLVVAVGTSAGVLYMRAAQIESAAHAYLFGYPLVMMDITRAAAQRSLGPENALYRAPRFPQIDNREVVRPNVDTLYTMSFIDMDKGPWVFAMSANDARYALMPFMDAWTNVFAAPGTRTTGAAAATYLLAGRNWQGSVPTGMTLLRAPTRIVWLIGRTQTNGEQDYALVHHLQQGLSLQSLADFEAGRREAPPAWQRDSEPHTPPVAQMQAMSTREFYARLALLLPDNPPAAADAPMMAQLATLGVRPGEAPQWSWLDQACIALARHLAEHKVAEQVRHPSGVVNGWSTPPADVGNYGTDYGTRAVVAMIGLGANLPVDAIYPNTRVDAGGAALDGSHRYRLHFAAGALPPVRAFWSVTAYGADDFFIDNPLKRYALGSRDALRYNADGSLDLLVQATAPTQGDSNWLPVKAGQPFLLNARLYWPQPAALSGLWHMPAVERLD